MADRDDREPDAPDVAAPGADEPDADAPDAVGPGADAPENDDLDADDPDADEDDALSWEGDDDLGRTTSLTDPRAASAVRRPRSLTADGRPARPGEGDGSELSAEDADLEADLAVDGERPRRDPVRLLVTGVFALIYLALTVGWILAVSGVIGQLSSGETGLLDAVQRISQFLAFVAAPLWFVTTLQLTRDGRLGVRAGWLALGIPILMPWPYLMGFVQ